MFTRQIRRSSHYYNHQNNNITNRISSCNKRNFIRNSQISLSPNNIKYVKANAYTTTPPNNDNSECDIKLPEPTWSIKDLNLSQESNNNQQKFTYDLENLASKSYIDLNKMSTIRRNQIVNDLNNIMNCLSMVTTFKSEQSEMLTDEEIYDLPRGLTQAPVFYDGEEEFMIMDDRVGKCDDVTVSVEHKMKIDKDGTSKFFEVK